MIDEVHIEAGDTLSIESKYVEGTFEVTSTDIEDVGIAEMLAAGLVKDDEAWTLTWIGGNERVTLAPLDADIEYDVDISEIEKL